MKSNYMKPYWFKIFTFLRDVIHLGNETIMDSTSNNKFGLLWTRLKMKKVLSIITLVTIVFASCTNSSESEDTNPTGEIYKVTLNVSNFNKESNPLKAASNKNQLHYAFYDKETGNLVKSKIIDNDQIVEEVTAGSYYVAIISAPAHDKDKVVFTPSNFYSDYCKGNPWTNKGRDNQFIYYKKVRFSTEKPNNQLDVELEPMWTQIDIQITDAGICPLPEGTDIVRCVVSPYYFVFDLVNGIASEKYDDFQTESTSQNIPFAQFRKDKGLQ